MRLHENSEFFSDVIQAASYNKKDGGMGIKSVFLEKDYWICRSLKLMAACDVNDKAVFKGGTSLTKAYQIGNRFSEDIDIAILDAWTLSGNQLKMLIHKTAKNMTAGLEEIYMPGVTSKGSHYHKAYYAYPRMFCSPEAGDIKTGQLLVEINSFANPYPFKRCLIQSFLTTYLNKMNNTDLVEQYDLHPFEVKVLDARATLTEKMVSMFRCSLADDYYTELAAKIRHFYDIHFLLKDKSISQYLDSNAFKSDFISLFEQDQKRFFKPAGWQSKKLFDSPFIKSPHEVWSSLSRVYMRELPGLAYGAIPPPDEIETSLLKVLSYLGVKD